MSQSARFKIRELRALLDDGLLSPQEFEARKNAILDAQLAPSSPGLMHQPPAATVQPLPAAPTTGLGLSPVATHPGVAAANHVLSTHLTELGLMTGQEIGPQNKRYRLEKFLGQGGMGQVWQALDLATHAQLGQHERVALKILPPQLTQSSLHARLLVEEATQARKLAHEHIVRVYEWAQDPATTSYFIIMELLEGCDLQQHLERHGRFSLEQIQTLLAPVAKGLRYAWDKHRMVHRDLKPGNLFLTRQQEVKLLDFGIAARLHSSGMALGLQLPPNVGTAGYRAPEAAHAQPARQLDVYSVAVMIYQMLSGHLPQRLPLPPAPGLSSAQWQLLQAALAAQPEQRPPHVLALLQGLQQAGTPLTLLHGGQAESMPHPKSAPASPAAAPAPKFAPLPAAAPAPDAHEQQARLQERARIQQEKRQREQEAREHAARQLKRVKHEQQQQLQKEREREQLLQQQKARELQEKRLQEAQLLQQRARREREEREARLTQQALSLDVALQALQNTNLLEKLLNELLGEVTPQETASGAEQGGRATGSIICDPFLDGSGSGPKMVVVPGGRFLMGSSLQERQIAIVAGSHSAWLEREAPQHWVAIPQPPAFGKYPVTCGEWLQFVRETGWRDDSDCPPPDFMQEDNHPVVGVSWRDANMYAQWLSIKTGQRYRLPSEAEWEYACRAGSSTAFSCGDSISTEQANYDGNFTYNGGSKGQFRRGTTAVDSFPPNAWGLHDMHGNVWEWVADAVHDNYLGAPTDGSAWQEGGDPGRRILRGGCWLYNPRYLRSALRNAFWQAGKNDIVGFRLVRELD